MQRNRDVLRQVGRLALAEGVCVAVMLAIYGVLGRFTRQVLFGGLLGGALAVVHFFLLSVSIANVLEQAQATGDTKRGTLVIQAASSVRLLIIGAILAAAFWAKLCDPVAALLPLLLSQLLIKLIAFFYKGDDENA